MGKIVDFFTASTGNQPYLVGFPEDDAVAREAARLLYPILLQEHEEQGLSSAGKFMRADGIMATQVRLRYNLLKDYADDFFRKAGCDAYDRDTLVIATILGENLEFILSCGDENDQVAHGLPPEKTISAFTLFKASVWAEDPAPDVEFLNLLDCASRLQRISVDLRYLEMDELDEILTDFIPQTCDALRRDTHIGYYLARRFARLQTDATARRNEIHDAIKKNDACNNRRKLQVIDGGRALERS